MVGLIDISTNADNFSDDLSGEIVYIEDPSCIRAGDNNIYRYLDNITDYFVINQTKTFGDVTGPILMSAKIINYDKTKIELNFNEDIAIPTRKFG